MLRSPVRMLPATRGAGVTAAPSPFAQAAPNLSALGYSCLPLVPSSVARHRGRGKCPGVFRAGHWQALEGWEKRKDAPLSGFELSMAMSAPEANIGVILGTVARPGLHTIAIDLDLTDSEALDTLVRCMPASPMIKKGAKGMTLFYAAPKSVTSRSFDDHRIPRESGVPRRLADILTGFATKQTVCPPSLHPDGPTYEWLAGPVPASELPVFDDDAMTVLEEALQEFGYDPDAARGGRGERKPYIPTEVGADIDDPFEMAKRAALANLAAWVFDVDHLGGLRPARGGFEAVNLRRSSSSGRPDAVRKRNLSINPTGIQDFGTGETWSAIDLVAEFNGVSVSEALSFLEERLGLNQDDGFSVDFSGMLASQEQRAVQVEVPATVEIVSHATEAGMPQHLIDGCPGLLGGIAEFITASARKPQPTFALAAAIMILGTAAGRVYAGPTDSGTHLYSVICGASGVGKDHPLDMAARILEACDMGMHVGPGEFMSHQAVYKTLSRQPLLLCPMDELGSFLGRLSKKGAAGNEAAVTGVMRTAWGKSFGSLQVPGWATQDMPTIYAPAMSIIGASTPQEFFRSLESGSIDNGFLNRWLLFPSYLRPDAVAPAVEKFVVPQQIVDGIKAVYNAGSAMTRATMHNGRCDTPFIRARWEGGPDGPLAREYRLWSSRIDEQSDTESLFARVSEQTIRIATIRAIGNDAANPVVDRASLTWAKELVLWSTQAMVSQSADFMAENQTEADRARVLRAIKRHGTITHRDLTRSLTTFKARDLDDMVKLLEVAELIAVSREVSPTNGKTTRRYIYVGDEA